jgi:hypothetical protein
MQLKAIKVSFWVIAKRWFTVYLVPGIGLGLGLLRATASLLSAATPMGYRYILAPIEHRPSPGCGAGVANWHATGQALSIGQVWGGLAEFPMCL